MSMTAMSQQGRRRVVAVVWMAVGLMLIVRGLPYAGLLHFGDTVGLTGNDTWIALGLGIVVGIAKGCTLLRKGARRAVRNIVDAGESAPAWTVFNAYMIVLVLVMIGAGLVLRLAHYDAHVKAWVVGILYPGIGIALIIGGWLATSVEPLPAKSGAR